MHTEIQENNEKLITGALKACDVVCSTMGPHGQSVGISHGNVFSTSKDGVNVVGNIQLKDPAENAGAKVALDACKKTVDEVGDGTTQTAAIIRGLLQGYKKYIFNSRFLSESMSRMVAKTTEYLHDSAIKVDPDDIGMLAKVAATSINNNAELGLMVAKLASETGKGGTIYIEDRPNKNQIKTEVKTGYNFDKGAASLHFFPKGQPRYLPIEHPLFILSEDPINDQKHLLPIMAEYRSKYAKQPVGEGRIRYNRALVIISPGITGSALEFVLTSLRDEIPVFAVNAPNFETIMDLSIITGAFIFSDATTQSLRKFNGKGISKDKNPFGEANEIKVTDTQTSILFDKTDKVIEYAKSLEDKDRKAALDSGIGYIYVGADSETEMRNIAQLLDDAQYAVYSAMKNGVIEGGGYTLAKVPGLENTPEVEVFRSGIEGPVRTILGNAGMEIKKLDKYLNGNFNARTLEFDEECEVYDAVESAVSSIKNAVSVFNEIIKTTNILIWKN